MPDVDPCKIDGCTSKSKRRIKGACPMHDTRQRTTGSYGPPGRYRAEWNQDCDVPECKRRAQSFGLCIAHRRRVEQYGDVHGVPPKTVRRCSLDECDSKHWAKGYCRKHYKRWLANGTPHLHTWTFEERFWAQVKCGADDECWLWTGATIKGYGHSHDNREHYYAHRRSYEMANGSIPDGMVVRHTCDNPPCVNPRHLVIGTQTENVADMVARGRGHWQRGTTGGAVARNMTMHPASAVEMGMSELRVGEAS